MMRARCNGSFGNARSAGLAWGRMVAAFAALLLAATQIPARAEDPRVLQSVDFTSLDGDRVQLTLTLSAPAPQPVVFTVDKPARLALDLPDTKLGMSDHFGKIGIGNVRSYTVASAKDRTRLVVDLTEPVADHISVEGNKVLLVLDAGPGAANSPAVSAEAAAAGAAIGDIDFRRGDKGEGRVIVTLSNSHIPVDVQEQGGNVVATFKGAALPDRLARRLDVLDFATPVKYVDTFHDGNNTKLVITPSAGADFEQVAYQAGDVFTLELQPLTQDQIEAKKRAEPIYTGQRISLSFQNVDVRALLQIIADVAGTNMVVSDSVQGSLAMRLQNVPWDQALDIILRTKGLGMRREGNVMLVAPLSELAARDKAEAEANKSQVALAPLHSEIMQVNYAKAADIAALLKSGDNSIMSDRGKVTVDERTNTLLVLDTRDKLGEIRALIQRLDVPVQQVLIESRIVVAKDNADSAIGARFGLTAFNQANNGNLATTSGTTTSGTNTMNSGYVSSSGSSVTLPNGDYNVNLPAAPAAGTAASMATAILGKNFLVDLELSALQSEGTGEVISSPRVITANAKQATIKQGVEIPYQQGTSSGATSVTFKDAVLELDVTPQITPDKRVIMDLTVRDDSVGSIVPSGNGGSIPSIDTREVKTQVLVDNGQTVVLGGIYQRTVNETITKVPLLGDIPVLGHLFKNVSHQNDKTELLIFITPKLLSEGLKVGTVP
jgi:type IV pilus assembly protein PilQ